MLRWELSERILACACSSSRRSRFTYASTDTHHLSTSLSCTTDVLCPGKTCLRNNQQPYYVFKLLYGDRRGDCTLWSDNSGPICSTSDKQKEHPPPFFVILAPDAKLQTYLRIERNGRCILTGASLRESNSMGMGFTQESHENGMGTRSLTTGSAPGGHHYAVQGHSRSPILIPMESRYATSYEWLIVAVLHLISHRFQVIAGYWSNLRFRQSAPRSGWTGILTTEKFGVKELKTSLYRVVQNAMRYLEPSRRESVMSVTDGRINEHNCRVSNSV